MPLWQPWAEKATIFFLPSITHGSRQCGLGRFSSLLSPQARFALFLNSHSGGINYHTTRSEAALSPRLYVFGQRWELEHNRCIVDIDIWLSVWNHSERSEVKPIKWPATAALRLLVLALGAPDRQIFSISGTRQFIYFHSIDAAPRCFLYLTRTLGEHWAQNRQWNWLRVGVGISQPLRERSTVWEKSIICQK